PREEERSRHPGDRLQMNFLLSLLLSSASPASAAVTNPESFVYALVGDVDSLDPAYEYDGVSLTPVTQVYEPLVFYKGSSLTEFEPLLATQVPSKANGLISKDGRSYTFPVRKNVKFNS